MRALSVKIEQGQLRKWKESYFSETFYVVKVHHVKDEVRVEVRFLDSWGSEEDNYFYDEGSILKRTILVM